MSEGKKTRKKSAKGKKRVGGGKRRAGEVGDASEDCGTSCAISRDRSHQGKCQEQARDKGGTEMLRRQEEGDPGQRPLPFLKGGPRMWENLIKKKEKVGRENESFRGKLPIRGESALGTIFLEGPSEQEEKRKKDVGGGKGLFKG